MDNSSWIDRLYSDESLTDNLDDDDARSILAWGETELESCRSEADAEGIIGAIREINRRVGDGETFAALMLPPRAATAPLPQSDAITPAANAAAGSTPTDAPDPTAASAIGDDGTARDGRDSTENNQRPS